LFVYITLRTVNFSVFLLYSLPGPYYSQVIAHKPSQLQNILMDLINELPGNSSVNTGQHARIHEAVFSLSSAQNSAGTTGLCNQLLGNGSVNIFSHIGPCYGSGDIINNRDDIFHGVSAEELS
jgi:hypothetical protein